MHLRPNAGVILARGLSAPSLFVGADCRDAGNQGRPSQTGRASKISQRFTGDSDLLIARRAQGSRQESKACRSILPITDPSHIGIEQPPGHGAYLVKQRGWHRTIDRLPALLKEQRRPGGRRVHFKQDLLAAFPPWLLCGEGLQFDRYRHAAELDVAVQLSF